MTTVTIIITIINILVAFIMSLGGAPILVWMERRVAGFIQDRPGPNRCNIAGIRLGGLIQSFADMLKLVFKEDFQPSHIKKGLYFTLAPVIVFVTAFLTFMVMPLADNLVINGKSFIMQALPIEFGVLWFLAFAGLSVYGIMLGGWASNNKYSLLGGIRASAQMISYEASMVLALISMLVVYGSIHLSDIAAFQGKLIWGFIPAWGIILQPIAAIIFIVTAFAETNRAPFDIAEGESEIVGGFHTEYSAMKFGLFFVGEYVAMCASSALIVTLFFGGYQLPFMNTQFLQSNINGVLVGLSIFLPLVTFFFIKWMKRQNRWPNEADIRNKETGVLVKFSLGVNVLILGLIAYLLLSGLSTNGINITVAILQVITFGVKVYLMNFVYIWVRWTLPRFRYDQLQHLGWKILLPLSLANIFVTATFVVVMGV